MLTSKRTKTRFISLLYSKIVIVYYCKCGSSRTARAFKVVYNLRDLRILTKENTFSDWRWRLVGIARGIKIIIGKVSNTIAFEFSPSRMHHLKYAARLLTCHSRDITYYYNYYYTYRIHIVVGY